MSYERTYPIIHIYPTVQGQGPRMGEPMTLIRTSSPPQFKEYLYHETVRPANPIMMPAREIVNKCIEIGLEWVFFGGDDPCINEFDYLAKALKDEKFKIWLDTTGLFPVNHMLIDHLSTGPKPLLPFHPRLVETADDVRLYWGVVTKIWEECYEQVLPYVRSDCPIFISPRVLTQECIDAVIKFVLSKAGSKPIVRADIPLFRTLPNFDKNFNEGQSCPICHLMDEFQGVKVKSILDKEKDVRVYRGVNGSSSEEK